MGLEIQYRCEDISQKQTYFSFCLLNLSPSALLSEKERQMNVQSYVSSYKIVGWLKHNNPLNAEVPVLNRPCWSTFLAAAMKSSVFMLKDDFLI